MKNILVLGATSAIAQATAKLFAADGAALFLVARNPAKLAVVADDMRTRGASRVETYALDLTDTSGQAAMLDAVTAAFGTLDAALIAYGTLGDQAKSQADADETLREWHTNATSVIALATRLANIFEGQKHGCLAVITSVAGDRGRKSNYVYGAAKGALNVFLDGLRGRLVASGVSVVTIKPGFVDTPMTADLPKNFLFAPPERVAKDIHTAMHKGTPRVYTPAFWRYLMLVIKAIPGRVFDKLNF